MQGSSTQKNPPTDGIVIPTGNGIDDDDGDRMEDDGDRKEADGDRKEVKRKSSDFVTRTEAKKPR